MKLATSSLVLSKPPGPIIRFKNTLCPERKHLSWRLLFCDPDAIVSQQRKEEAHWTGLISKLWETMSINSLIFFNINLIWLSSWLTIGHDLIQKQNVGINVGKYETATLYSICVLFCTGHFNWDSHSAGLNNKPDVADVPRWMRECGVCLCVCVCVCLRVCLHVSVACIVCRQRVTLRWKCNCFEPMCESDKQKESHYFEETKGKSARGIEAGSGAQESIDRWKWMCMERWMWMC